MKKLIINTALCIAAAVLFLPLYVINMAVVLSKGHSASGFFRSTALSIDRYANYEFRALFNAVLVKTSSAYRFGKFDDTISRVLAVNHRAKTLSRAGKILYRMIDVLDRGHFENL